MSRTKVMAQNPVVLKIPKTAEKAWVSHWRHFCQRKTAAICRSKANRDARERLV